MDYFKKRRARIFFRDISLTNWIIVTNVLLFFVFYIISLSHKDFYLLLAVQPSSVLIGERVWTLLTSVFTHQLVFHLFVNMFSLYFLGNLTERLIGRKRLFWLYIIAGIIGSIFFVLFAQLGTTFSLGSNVFGGINDYAVGASGAIFGLLGLLAMILPKKKVYLVIGPLIILILDFVVVRYLPQGIAGAFDLVMSILVFVSIFAMFAPSPRIRRIALPVEMSMWVAPIAAIVPLILIGIFVQLPIGNTAHLGGLIAGLVFGYYLRVRYRKKVMILQKYIK